MDVANAWLIPIAGPALVPIEVPARPGGATLGRGEACTIRLPAEADKVSRLHARLVHDPQADGWRIADQNSRWGTTLNGVKLPPGREVPLAEGDLIAIVPWTFAFSTRGVPKRGLLAEDDTEHGTTLIRSLHSASSIEESAPALGENLLTLLLDSADAIHAAGTEKDLAEALIDAAIRGTGLGNAAVLRPLDAEGRLDVVAARRASVDSPAGFSRTLLKTAATGVVAELSADSSFEASASMVSLGIEAAICAPLMLGESAAAFLYVDDRGVRQRARPVHAAASAFCLALARMAGLALANLKRIEIEKRQAALELDLTAAARAQKFILPKGQTTVGRLICTGQSRAGAYVGGDFFDVIPLGDNRVAVALGDVTGHGVAAGVLMTAAQGFFHAAVQHAASLAEAVTDLNRFLYPRRPVSSFLTLWAGIFDADAGTLTYVNAGHGYALLQSAGGVTMLDGGDDFPIGFDEAAVYSQIVTPLPAGGRAVVLSDGVVEQFDPGRIDERQQFGMDRVRAVLNQHPSAAAIGELFSAVFAHADADTLQDDATAVMVTWA